MAEETIKEKIRNLDAKISETRRRLNNTHAQYDCDIYNRIETSLSNLMGQRQALRSMLAFDDEEQPQ